MRLANKSKRPRGKQPLTVITWEGKPYTIKALVSLLGISRQAIHKKYQEEKLETYMYVRLKKRFPKGHHPKGRDSNGLYPYPFGRPPKTAVTWEGKEYTAAELAELLQVSTGTIYNYLYNSKLKDYLYKRLQLGLPKDGDNPYFFTYKNKKYRMIELTGLLRLTKERIGVLRKEGKLAAYMKKCLE
jgi:predicted DNA-binding transcriptional regulator AlpA